MSEAELLLELSGVGLGREERRGRISVVGMSGARVSGQTHTPWSVPPDCSQSALHDVPETPALKGAPALPPTLVLLHPVTLVCFFTKLITF